MLHQLQVQKYNMNYELAGTNTVSTAEHDNGEKVDSGQ